MGWKFLTLTSLSETMGCIYYCGEKSDSSWAMTGGDTWRVWLFRGLCGGRSIYGLTQVTLQGSGICVLNKYCIGIRKICSLHY